MNGNDDDERYKRESLGQQTLDATSSGADSSPPVKSDDMMSRGSVLLRKMDFFNLYGLPEYKPSSDNSEDNYLGYIPIIIRNASFYGDEVGEKTSIDFEHEENKKIDIKLPWLPSEISDSVSVSYSRRGNTGVQLPEAMSRLASKLSKNLANIVLVEYNAQNLSKTLDLEFILPINRTLLTAGGTHYTTELSKTAAPDRRNQNIGRFREENIEVKDFMKNVRAYLGALQGLVYPRAYGFLYPPLLAIKLGGLYRGFKGFLREVNIRTSEEMLDLGSEMFPMVIRGSLRFINVFMYSWADTRNEIARSFVLSDNPQILFGMDYKDEELVTGVSAGENLPGDYPGAIDNLGISATSVSEPGLTAIQRAYDRYKNFGYVDVEYDSLNRAYQNMKNFDVNREFGQLNFDSQAIQYADIGYSSVINSLNNDQFNFLGIDNNNKSLTLSTGIQSIVGSVQDVSNYASLLSNIREKDLFSSLSGLSRIVSSSNSALSSSIRDVIDLYWPVVSILSTIDTGVDLDNVTNFYSDILRVLSTLENSALITKNDLNNIAYTDSLYVEKSLNIINEVNRSLNSDIIQNPDLAPITSLYFSNLMLLETEVLKNMDNLKDVNQLMYEASYDLKSRGLLTEREVVNYKQAYDISKSIDTTVASNVNDLLYTNLNRFKEVLES